MTSGAIHSKVYGATHENTDGTSRQQIIEKYVRQGMKLIAKPEPDNPKDRFAIGLWIHAKVNLFTTKEFQVGYINAELSKELARYLENGGKLDITANELTGGKGKNFGVNITIQKH